jgi:predicted RNA binding protein YcfA (HicA-like mRNA interferase family)
MSSFRKDMKRLRKAAEQQGWRVEDTRGGHVRFLPPDRSQPAVVAGGTPSDHRSWLNLLAMLRRAGLDV